MGADLEEYEIHKTKYGYYVIGGFPVDEVEALMKFTGNRGVFDFPIGWHYGACIVISFNSKAWREALGITEETIKRDVEAYEERRKTNT